MGLVPCSRVPWQGSEGVLAHSFTTRTPSMIVCTGARTENPLLLRSQQTELPPSSVCGLMISGRYTSLTTYLCMLYLATMQLSGNLLLQNRSSFSREVRSPATTSSPATCTAENQSTQCRTLSDSSRKETFTPCCI